MKISLEIPEQDRDRLISALKAQDPALLELLAPPGPAFVRDLYEGRSSWPKQRTAHQAVENVCCGFHIVARKLQLRHDGRATLQVVDEHDMQDLLGALLALEFTDIRREEWTPSYAGGASRVDFLLKPEKIVVEAKRTRDGLGARQLGDELLIDVGRYKSHPDCQSLVCFVYDPDGRILNPCGLENDLNGIRDGINVKVIITPKGV